MATVKFDLYHQKDGKNAVTEFTIIVKTVGKNERTLPKFEKETNTTYIFVPVWIKGKNDRNEVILRGVIKAIEWSYRSVGESWEHMISSLVPPLYTELITKKKK